MILAAPLVTFILLLEYAFNKFAKIGNVIKLVVTSIAVILLMYYVYQSEQLVLLTYDFGKNSFSQVVNKIVFSERVYWLYVLAWFFVTNIFSSWQNIVKVNSLNVGVFILLFGFNLSHSYMLILISIVFFLDIIQDGEKKNSALKYFLLVVAMITSVVTSKALSIYFPVSYLKLFTLVEYFVLSSYILYVSRNNYTFQKNEISNMLLMSLLVLYYISLKYKPYADTGFANATFAMFIFIKTIYGIAKERRLIALNIMQNVLIVLAVYSDKEKFIYLISFYLVTMITHIGSLNKKIIIKDTFEINKLNNWVWIPLFISIFIGWVFFMSTNIGKLNILFTFGFIVLSWFVAVDFKKINNIIKSEGLSNFLYLNIFNFLFGLMCMVAIKW
jgi:hypothetical protein